MASREAFRGLSLKGVSVWLLSAFSASHNFAGYMVYMKKGKHNSSKQTIIIKNATESKERYSTILF
jgi:hypothetical protein